MTPNTATVINHIVSIFVRQLDVNMQHISTHALHTHKSAQDTHRENSPTVYIKKRKYRDADHGFQLFSVLYYTH